MLVVTTDQLDHGILDDGRAARSAVKAHVARVLKRKLPFELDAAEHMVVGTQHGEVVPDKLVERFAIAGTPTEAREQLERLAASGLVGEIAIIPHTQDPRDRDRIIRLVGEMIPASSRRG